MTKAAQDFVRFVSADRHPTVDAELGMFTARDSVDFSALCGGLQRAHDEAWYWFSARGGGGLYLPRLQGRARTREVRKSLFWFKAEAAFPGHEKGSVVRRARQLAEVLRSWRNQLSPLNVPSRSESVLFALQESVGSQDGVRG
jgi:hypothetical protein